MRRIWRGFLASLWLVAVSVLLTGCLSSSKVEDLFTPPQPPIEYTGLADVISGYITGGYEYASPTAGQNIQAVQVVDLDSNGRNEALAFFRKPGDEKPLKIVVFQSLGGRYEQLTTIESSGTAIERVEYQDMNGDGVREVVVGWKISADVRSVAVYAMGEEPTMLMQSSYTRYSIEELDGDGIPSLMLLRSNDQGASVAEFYGWGEESMTLSYSSPLSSTMAAISRGSVVSGQLEEGVPAVFVTGINEQGKAVTDILACRENGTLTNPALGSTGFSVISYPDHQILPQDINGDGVIEIPAPHVTLSQDLQRDGVVDWLNCDLDGDIWRVATTYHRLSEGWYVMLPETWSDDVTVLNYDTGDNERQTLLRLGNETAVGIYTITGENRESRALRGSRQVLRRRTDVIYAGEIFNESAGLNAEGLHSAFHLILDSWVN